MVDESGPQMPHTLPTLQMENILQDLQEHTEDILHHEAPYRAEIRGEVTPEQLRALTELPFEVSIVSGERNRLVLRTGTPESTRREGPEARIDDLAIRKFVFHTHPARHGVVFDAPSYDDLGVAAVRGGHVEEQRDLMPSILAHPNGLLVYLIDHDQFDEISRKMAAFRSANADALEHAPDDPNTLALQAAAEREFFEEADATVLETTWDNRAGVEFVLQMFREALN